MTKGGTELLSRGSRYLANIKQLNSRINALVSFYPEEKVLKTQEDGDPFVVVIKDNFCTNDLPTTCGSEMLRGYRSPFDSTPVALLRKSGFNLIGKANMDGFAMGVNNSFSCFGQTLNPLFSTPTSPGGSSGGSAAAVAAEFCDVALGSDTGGSVHLTAAYCSVLGFKPSYGLISRYGVIDYAQSLDTVGILAREMEPLRKVFDTLNQYDENDPTSLRPSSRAKLAAMKRPAKSLKIGVIEETILDMSPEVKDAWVKTLEQLESLGHTIHAVNVPTLKYTLPTYFMIAPAEASSNLARYDGVRYGHRAKVDRDDNDTLYSPTRMEGLGAEVQRRLLLGTFNLSAGEFEGHFGKAQKVRRLLCDEFNSIFATKNILAEQPYKTGDIDVVVHPAAPSLPPAIEDVAETDPIEHYTTDVLTAPANLAGLPAISVPRARAIGIQVWGQYGDDDLVLQVASQILPDTGAYRSEKL